jgi:minor extracellular protease Epr
MRPPIPGGPGRIMASLFRAVAVTIAVALPAAAALAQPGDWGGFEDAGDFFDWAFPTDDPADFASDVDEDFEPDELLALNLGRKSAAILRQLGFRIREGHALATLKLRLYRLRPPRGMGGRQALVELRKADPSGYYDLNGVYRLAGATGATAPAGCEGVRCYAQAMIGWNTAGCGAPMRLGMLDTAVDARHAALAGRKVVTHRLARTPAAGTDHGTAVAALLVGSADSAFPGLLPEAQLFAADVFSVDRQGRPYTDAAELAKGLDWLAAQQPDAINISITGPDGGVLHTAIRRVTQLGIGVVAAAGNLGPRSPPQYPAAYREVIAVTAVDRKSQVYVNATQGPYVALAAPGVDIWTAGAGGSGVFREGTSFAAPFATAALAVLKSREPALAPAAMLGHLRKLARDLGPPGADSIYGAGLLQAQACGI